MRTAICFFVSTLVLFGLASAQEFKITQEEDGVTINVDGKLFARYLTKGHKKPVIWPIVGPTGKEMTRVHPFKDDPEDKKRDHIHHESFWFDHGNVNGTDFWMIGEKSGVIQHREFSKTEEGKSVLLVTKNDWLAEGKKICEDTRWIRFSADAKSRWVDFEVEVSATEGELKFGDTKEGSFGVRVPITMEADRKQEPGTIENSEGQKNGDAWGKPAKWVDYSGLVGGEKLGIAILNHPSSFRFPTTWHVRTYGLFAANPFGAKEFKVDPAAYGEHIIPAGGKMRLAYRVLFHSGDARDGEVEKVFGEYSSTKLSQP
jgi:Methane oxygenase PmoA